MRNFTEPPRERPPAPPAPWHTEDTVQELKHIVRLDTNKPGLYVVRFSTVISKARKKDLFQELYTKINVFAPGSELVILPPYVGTVEIQTKSEPEPSDAWINERIGKKETRVFPKWLRMEDAPRDRYILTRHNGDCHVVRWNDDTSDWVCSEDNWYLVSEWMELPK